MLVVIAIIAVLAAILFPVMAQVRETARRNTVISNLAQINSAVNRYYLDHQNTYPPVLFGYADPGGTDPSGKQFPPLNMETLRNETDAKVNMASNSAPDYADMRYSTHCVGLYPTYIADYKVFMDPDSPWSADGTSTTTVPFYESDPAATGDRVPAMVHVTGTTMAAPLFYDGDAIDISPQITAKNAINDGTPPLFVARYQQQWTDILPQGQDAPSQFPASNQAKSPVGNGHLSYQDYLRQLAVPGCDGSAYVTSLTYHVPSQNKVIVLFKDGSVKTWDSDQYLAPDPGYTPSTAFAEPSTVAPETTPVSEASQAKFWTLTPTGTF